MKEQLRKDLEEIFNDPILAWVNEDSVKRMSEVVRDVFPKATKNEVCACLEMFWEEKDTPESLYTKLWNSKVA